VDGGVLDPVPVQRALDLDAERVYVFGEAENIDPASHRMSALGVLIRSFAISRYTPLPDPAAMARLVQRVIVLPAAETAGIDMRDFSQTQRLISESYHRCRERLTYAA
jgi:predicted acylesterase/phospholipase RssA